NESALMPRRWFTYGTLLAALGLVLILAGLGVTFVQESLYGFILIMAVAMALKAGFGLGMNTMERSPLDTLEDRRYAQGRSDKDLDDQLADALWRTREDERYSQRDVVCNLDHTVSPDAMKDV
ncbi:MAG: hypothetical protein AAGF99_03470, partial [Bacteroidota bacterium]